MSGRGGCNRNLQPLNADRNFQESEIVMNLFRKAALGLTLAFGALLSGTASAAVICNNCAYITGGGSVATYLGDHNPQNDDNSTFGNATTGQNGAFSNWWVFKIDPAGLASVNAIFLPINNISNFDVKLYSLTAETCAAQTAGSSSGAACTVATTGALMGDGFTSPAYATVIDFTFLDAGFYAFNVTGTISGLGATQPASYTGNLQVAVVPEPASLALVALSLVIGGLSLRSRRA